MSKYMMKYKNKYRLKVPYDKSTNDFPRDADGGIDSNYDDIYISCKNGVEIYNYGHGVLCAYVPSITRANNIINAVNEIDKNIIIDVQEGDIEKVIKFKDRDLDKIIHLFKPHTSGASISPFSKRNLPSSKQKKKPYTYKSDDMYKIEDMLSELHESDQSIYLKFFKYMSSIDKKKKYYGQEYKPIAMVEIYGHIHHAIAWLENCR